MKKAKLGTGERFKALSKKLENKGATNPDALAAFIGRKKFGKKKFQKLAEKGKKDDSNGGYEKEMYERRKNIGA